MATYLVKSKAVKVAVGPKNGNRVAHIVRQGGVVPEGVEKDTLKSLLERGLIVKDTSAGEDGSAPEGDPSEKWTASQLKAYAVEKGIDLGDAKNKGDVLEVILAAAAGEDGSGE